MKHSPFFLKLRVIMFSLTTIICLVWAILLSCVLFIRWDLSSSAERSFVTLFLVIDAMTTIILPVLLLVKFRTWLDGARLLFLLTCHLGLAASFAAWTPTISCPDDTPDDHGVCQLLNVYIIMASWVPPFLLITYGCCLATYTWRYASRPRGELPSADEEAGLATPSLWGAGASQDPSYSNSLASRHLSRSDDLNEDDVRRDSSRKSRLEKRLPNHLFGGF
ncbi:hypothetical protein BC834DRAFT_854422 [Gloeopeniophorella convolvens]|nr:hypothetical protein BC834DRAFT_854422 [Gloeopeniophorella convolvens]